MTFLYFTLDSCINSGFIILFSHLVFNFSKNADLTYFIPYTCYKTIRYNLECYTLRDFMKCFGGVIHQLEAVIMDSVM